MPSGFVPPCIPTRAPKPPAGTDWVREIKHDGYRLQVRREGDTVRLFTRKGYDWSARYPAIAVTATRLPARSFTLDGEAVVCGPDGVAVFDALHRHGTVTEAMMYPFDLLELDGEDLRGLPLGDRKKRLARLLARRHRPQRAHRRRWRPSGRPACWALKASCRSGSARPTGRDGQRIG
jgi:bifunctional non-homologous end joining protein LigD